jgi:hypothetical protein
MHYLSNLIIYFGCISFCSIAAKRDVAGDERQRIAYYCLGFGNFILVMEESAQFEIWGLG